MKRPYYSIVVVGRNDDYGRHFLFRFKQFFTSLSYQIDKYSLHCEIVLVEWNPLRDRKRLSAILKKNFSNFPATIRVITVPNTIHKQFAKASDIPLFEVIAKNTGIRRAKGKFILATNPDLIYPNNLIKFLARQNLQERTLYRADRINYKLDNQKDVTVYNQFEKAKRGAFILHTFGCRIFLRQALPFALKLWLGYVNAFLMRRLISRQKRLLTPVHVNAAGDFTLMHRKYWFKLRGYPERQALSYFDTYPCFGAVALGLKQHVFKYNLAIFHLSHEQRQKKLPHRGSEKQLYRDYYAVLSHERSPIFNTTNWGLKDLTLKETVIN